MPVVAVLAFVDGEAGGNLMVILSDTSGGLGIFARVVADFVHITNPTALGLVGLRQV